MSGQQRLPAMQDQRDARCMMTPGMLTDTHGRELGNLR